MNPLSPLTYYRRHKGSALLLMSIICLATAGLFVMVGVLDSIPMRAHTSYLTKISRVYPATGGALEAGVGSQLQAHPDIARVILDNGLQLAPPTLIGLDSLRLMGVSQDDAQFLMADFGVCLKEGRMFEPRTNEIMLSEEVVRALGLRLGDSIERSISDTYYAAVPSPLMLVGILEGDLAAGSGPSVRVGFASHEYLESHELFAPRPQSLLIVAQQGRKDAVDGFLETKILSVRTEVETYGEIAQYVTLARQMFYVVFGVVNCLVAVIVAMVVGVINRIALTRRVEELGLLHAVGYPRTRLIGRMTLETGFVAGIGWGLGLGLALLALSALDSSLYYAKGMELDLGNSAPFWFTIPIPAVVIAFAALSARSMFRRLDTVAIIERGKLSMETEKHGKKANRSSSHPLSSLTFYLRHRRRGILLVASMALMILAVAFPVFLITAASDAAMPGNEPLHFVSEVSPGTGDAVDPGVAAQIRTHPTVERLIPAIPLGLSAVVPPAVTAPVAIYGISEGDLPVLMDQFGVQIVEGRLPRARSNEIVLSKAVATNRGLRVGDSIGRPLQKDDDDLFISDDMPAEMTIVGLLSRDDVWLGFASLEYLESHELTSARQPHLLVLPKNGREAELEAWLEEHVASTQTEVGTYKAVHRDVRQTTLALVALFTAVESIIAVIAAIALAALNHIFFAQRQDEFGVLYAIGRSRPWLVFRTVKETAGAVGLAWLLGAAVCMAGLLFVQGAIYAPRGLSLNLANLMPWLFTLPIPLAVVAVSSGTIGHMLRKLDPVATIERRV
ncbi:MAG TPA: FtsX-like permease family protein [Anaerolineae bacterium]|nr:FtsX-like permease family protein [Anaerolineae bacterium]